MSIATLSPKSGASVSLCFNYLFYYKHSLTLSKLFTGFFSFTTPHKFSSGLLDRFVASLLKYVFVGNLLSGFCWQIVHELVCVCSTVRTRTTPRARCLTCRRSWSSRRLSWAEGASCSGWTRMTGSRRTSWPKQHETGGYLRKEKICDIKNDFIFNSV